MQREAAGMANEVPMMIRAAGKLLGLIANAKKIPELTDIAPHWGPVNRIARPDDRVDKLV